MTALGSPVDSSRSPTPSSTARPARRRSSASGRYKMTSMPATILATRSSVMAGKWLRQNSRNVR